MTNTIKVIFQDKSILVLEKWAGLITISEDPKEQTAATLIEKEFGIDPQISIVHRLDKDTSGVMVIAKNNQVHDNLQDQFKDRKVKKEYLALVHGILEKGGIINAAVGRNPLLHNKFTVIEKGQPAGRQGREAATEYEPKEKFKVQSSKFKVWFPEFNNIQLNKLEKQNYGVFSLVICRPLTGRTHQIRVHLKYINHPIVSDENYAGRKSYKLDIRWCPRQFLHAAKLGFYHPESGEWMEFESELPEDLKKVLDLLDVKS